MKKLYLALAVVPIALLGCGGEGSGSDTSKNSASQQQSPVVYSQDGIVRTYTDEKLSVNLSERNVVSNGQKLAIDDITSLSPNAQCEPISVSGMTFELGAFENPTMCQYQYSLRSVETGVEYANPNMVTHVIVQEKPLIVQRSLASLRSLPSTTLPPIQVSVSKPGGVVNVDLNSRLASLYPKDENGKNYVLSSSILVLGSGSAKSTTDDLGKSIIEYTSDSYDRGGMTRLLYSLSDDFTGTGEGDFRVGAIDISVSASGTNSTPETKYFQWTNNGADIKVGQKYTIDVASDISAVCTFGREPQDTKGSCIYDSDGDSLQIVGVYAYDASVAPTSLTQLDNTKFDVTFNRTGIHDISYQVSDHNGGFATGIVRVSIKENSAPVLNKNPMIVYATENGTSYHGLASSHATDLEGDALSYKSVTQPESDKVTVSVYSGANEAFKGSLEVKASPDSEGVHPFDVVITDGQNDVTQHWLYVVNSSTHLSLKDVSERTFTTNVNTAITIDLRTLIQGYIWSGEADTITVTNTAGAMLGNVSVDENEKYKLIYTPNKNEMGIDDFVFEIHTGVGATIAGDIIVTTGNPPKLEIQSISATEGADNLITASMVCDNCDITKYEYEWMVDNKVVSNEKSFTITSEQRFSSVVLTVFGHDVFGQVAHKAHSFNFFKVVLGSFEEPAESCQAIYEQYNSPFALAADDGEYWISSSDGSYSYKTQCDMVTEAESQTQYKAIGGYTLIWSYSEKTNLLKFGGDTRIFSQNNKKVGFANSSMQSDTLKDGRSLITAKDGGNVDYNNFRITDSEMKTKFGTAYTRLNYTSDPSPQTINEDEDGIVQNWFMNSTLPTTLYGGSDHSITNSSFNGKINGKRINAWHSASSKDVNYFNFFAENSNGQLEDLGESWFWASRQGPHFNIEKNAWGQHLNNFGGFWGEEDHQIDLIGLCTNPRKITLSGINAYGCNGGNRDERTYHENINNGEGYVIQWWAK